MTAIQCRKLIFPINGAGQIVYSLFLTTNKNQLDLPHRSTLRGKTKNL